MAQAQAAMYDDSDTTLVLAARDGDKEAFAQLLTRHGGLLRALCQRMLADPVLAEDATQEAMLQAMLNLDRLREAERFGPWLGGIGLNVSRRLLQERSRDRWSWETLAGDRPRAEQPDPEPGPEALTEAAELASEVHRAVASLPPGQRSAVVSYYLAGLTQAETAEMLGIDTGAVKTRLHKAREALRRRLEATWKDQSMEEKVSRRKVSKGAGTLAGIAVTGQLGSVAASLRQEEKAGVSEERTDAVWVAMRVTDVRRKRTENGPPGNCMAILDEVGGDHQLRIWIGEPEGTAIAVHLEQVEAPRPLTFAFMASVLQATGARLREVRINQLVESVYYAVAVVEGPEQDNLIDARPSDAINLALLTGAPILVDAAVLDAVAAMPDWAREVGPQAYEGPGEIVASLMGNLPPSQPR